jgi:hypothetical protein
MLVARVLGWLGAWQCAEALKHNRATLAGLRADYSLPFGRRG